MALNSLIEINDLRLFNSTGNSKQIEKPLLEIEHLAIMKGEILGIAGDSGTGKSLFSYFMSEEWEKWDGLITGQCHHKSLKSKNRLFSFFRPRESLFQKVRVIHQERYIPSALTAIQYLSMTNKRRVLLTPQITQTVREIIKEADIELTEKIENLDESKKTILCAIHAFSSDSKIVILDSIIHRLSELHLDILNRLIFSHKEKQGAVVILSRKIEQLYDWCDRIAILRDHTIVRIEAPTNVDRWTLLQLCYGEINKMPELNEKNDFKTLLKLNEAVLKELPVLLIYANRNQDILLMNNTARRFLELDETVENLTVSSLLDEKGYKLINEQLQQEQLFKIDSFDTLFNDKEVILSLSGFPVNDRNELVGHILVIEDQTEQEKIRQQLIISEKQYSVGILAAGVAHEINNPLEILTNNLDFITLEPNADEVKEAVTEMKEEIEDIRKIISNLISFTSFEKNDDQAINLNETITHLIKLIRFSADSKNIVINFHSSRDFFCHIGKTEFRQIITNLIKNSFEAIRSDGTINITLREIFSTQKGVNEILLCIEDNGCGMEENEISNIFLPFYTRKKGTGTNMGLGLSIIYNTIKRYEGTIEAEKIPDGGLRFLIKLPEADKAAGLTTLIN